jgi:hypothetical protein
MSYMDRHPVLYKAVRPALEQGSAEDSTATSSSAVQRTSGDASSSTGVAVGARRMEWAPLSVDEQTEAIEEQKGIARVRHKQYTF